jgi:hypothetical protein
VKAKLFQKLMLLLPYTSATQREQNRSAAARFQTPFTPYSYNLFLSEKDAYRHAGKLEIFAQLVLQVIAVRCFYIVGIIAKESE